MDISKQVNVIFDQRGFNADKTILLNEYNLDHMTGRECLENVSDQLTEQFVDNCTELDLAESELDDTCTSVNVLVSELLAHIRDEGASGDLSAYDLTQYINKEFRAFI